MDAPIMGGEALAGQGFIAVACLDTAQGQPGVRLTGTFNPQRADSLGRYGIDIFRPGISFIPEQYTGAHSTGLNSQAVALLGPVFEKMGISITANADRDKSDLDMLVGATQWVIGKAIDFKLLTPAAPPVDPPAPPPPPPPGPPVQPPSPPPAASGLHPLSPASVRVEELRAALFNVWFRLPGGALPWLGYALQPDNGWPWSKVFAVEALRVYRRLRVKLGDSRGIPAEDR